MCVCGDWFVYVLSDFLPGGGGDRYVGVSVFSELCRRCRAGYSFYPGCHLLAGFEWSGGFVYCRVSEYGECGLFFGGDCGFSVVFCLESAGCPGEEIEKGSIGEGARCYCGSCCRELFFFASGADLVLGYDGNSK